MTMQKISSNIQIKDTNITGAELEELSNGSVTTLHSHIVVMSGSNSICDGRLTLLSNTPVPTADQTAKTTVYFTPYIGNGIALYDGSKWNVRAFTELNVAVPATTNTPYDVFCYDNAGTPALETVNWTNNTTRATALVYQDGVLVKSGAATRRYLGTGRTTGVNGQCEDSVTKRFLWNYYNRRNRQLFKTDATSHTYASASWRYWNNDANNKVELVVGVQEDSLHIYHNSRINCDNGESATTSYGVDAITSSSLGNAVWVTPNSTEGLGGLGTARWYDVAAGYHYIAMTEYGAASSGDYVAGFVAARVEA